MNVGFYDTRFGVLANILVRARTMEELAKENAGFDAEDSISLLSSEDMDQKDLVSAAALVALANINNEPGSICRTLENLLARAFIAGQEYQKTKNRTLTK